MLGRNLDVVPSEYLNTRDVIDIFDHIGMFIFF